MKRVKFTTDFATKRSGDVCEYDGQVASQLVNVDQVAEYTTDPITEVEQGREHIEVPSDVVIGKKATAAPKEKTETEEVEETETDADTETDDADGDGLLISADATATEPAATPTLEADAATAGPKETDKKAPKKEAKK